MADSPAPGNGDDRSVNTGRTGTERLVVTGADGFLGWHLRVVARAAGQPDPVVVGREALNDPETLAGLLDGAGLVLHLAGANRGEPAVVASGNTAPAAAMAEGLRRCVRPPQALVFANSIQAGNGTPYGDAKASASATLATATATVGTAFRDVLLPNLFGEHGRPHYNSVVATFCATLAAGGRPVVREDRELDLLHATDAVSLLLGAEAVATPGETPHRCRVSTLAEQLTGFADTYRTAEIPALTDRFAVRLFNTYRSHCFPSHYPLGLHQHTDARGDLVEAVKVHGAGGQVFISSTKPGVVRGEHFHLAKVERFIVLRGEAEISLRRVLHTEVHRFRVSGAVPVVVDMPTMWTHNLRNVGMDDLLTLFWTNEHFDSGRPDTYPEPVG